MRAVIPAAGAGTRLAPLTDDCPKPLLPVKEGRPFLHYVLDALWRSGVVDEVIIGSSLPEEPWLAATHYAASAYPQMPVHIQPCPPCDFPGSGAVVAECAPHRGRDVLSVMGDTVPDPRTIHALAALPPGVAAVAVTPVDDPHRHLPVQVRRAVYHSRIEAFGKLEQVATIAAGDPFGPQLYRVKRISREWPNGRPAFVDAGAHRVTPAVLEALLEIQLPPNPAEGEVGVMDGLIARFNASDDIAAVRNPGEWLQIGDHEGVPGFERVCALLEEE